MFVGVCVLALPAGGSKRMLEHPLLPTRAAAARSTGVTGVTDVQRMLLLRERKLWCAHVRPP